MHELEGVELPNSDELSVIAIEGPQHEASKDVGEQELGCSERVGSIDKVGPVWIFIWVIRIGAIEKHSELVVAS